MLDYNKVKEEVELQNCAVHKQQPKIIIKESSDNISTNVSLDCCCTEFQQICIDEFKILLEEQRRKSIMDAFE
jgi:hypothetical protein